MQGTKQCLKFDRPFVRAMSILIGHHSKLLGQYFDCTCADTKVIIQVGLCILKNHYYIGFITRSTPNVLEKTLPQFTYFAHYCSNLA